MGNGISDVSQTHATKENAPSRFRRRQKNSVIRNLDWRLRSLEFLKLNCSRRTQTSGSETVGERRFFFPHGRTRRDGGSVVGLSIFSPLGTVQKLDVFWEIETVSAAEHRSSIWISGFLITGDMKMFCLQVKELTVQSCHRVWIKSDEKPAEILKFDPAPSPLQCWG